MFFYEQITENEARCGVMRLIVCGGRATETSVSKGAVVVGVRTLSEGGCVGNFSREQVQFSFCNMLIWTKWDSYTFCEYCQLSHLRMHKRMF